MVKVTAMSMAFLYISGKNKGKKFPLSQEAPDILIGRSPDAQMVIDDQKASVRHASVSTSGDPIVLKDLNSAQGTFVNGERVTEVRLKEGDRIRVGGVTFMLVSEGGFNPKTPQGPVTNKVDTLVQGKSSGAISGSIKEVSLADLLQFLSTSKKSGVLVIRANSDIGRVYLLDGQIYFASINGSSGIHPQRMLFRLLRWTSGSFELAPPDNQKMSPLITEGTDMLLLEGMRQLDELTRVQGNLPSPKTRVALARPCPGKFRDLTAEELDVLQLVIEYGLVQTILDNYPVSDLDALTHLSSFIERKWVVELGSDQIKSATSATATFRKSRSGQST